MPVIEFTQVMWPSDSLPELLTSPAYVRALAVAREILGDDLAFDFDMLIDKAPGTATPTPCPAPTGSRCDRTARAGRAGALSSATETSWKGCRCRSRPARARSTAAGRCTTAGATPPPATAAR